MKNLTIADISAETIKAALIKSEMFNEHVECIKDEASNSSFYIMQSLNENNEHLIKEMQDACYTLNRLHKLCIELQKLTDGGFE